MKHRERDTDIIKVQKVDIISDTTVAVLKYNNLDINYTVNNPKIVQFLRTDKVELAIKLIDLMYTEDLEQINIDIINNRGRASRGPYNKKVTTNKPIETLRDVIYKYLVKFNKLPNECDATIDNLFDLDYYKNPDTYFRYKNFIEKCRDIKKFDYSHLTQDETADLLYKKYRIKNQNAANEKRKQQSL